VEKLYHFTPAVNLESILRNGLASQRLLEAHCVSFFAPDRYRFDDRLDALSMSIHSINQALLLAKIAEHGGEWAILEIEASVLWTHRCRFCWTNAASADVTNYTAFLGGPYGFEEMFRDRPLNANDLRSQREVYARRENQPTDLQAEVQVFDPIDSDLIVDITVRNERVKRQLEALMDRIGEPRPVVICEQIFQ
jgi:hypothetical protein